MQKILIASLCMAAAGLNAAPSDDRLCLDARLIASGAVNHFEFRSYVRRGDEALLLGEGCYPNSLGGGEEECSSGTGSISSHGGKIELSFTSNELLPSAASPNGYAMQRASSHFLIDPASLKGEGATLVEFPDQPVPDLEGVFSVKAGIVDSTVELVPCGASHDSPTDEKTLSAFLKKADKL